MKRQRQLLCKVAAGALVFAVLLLAPRARADQDTDKNLKHKDTAFLKDAALGGMAEVQLGQLAQQKAQNDQIKQLGQKIQADHTKANQELQQVAQKVGVTVPSELDSKHRRLSENLEKKSGTDFDRAYAEHTIKDHKKDIKEFEKAARDSENADVKAFAEKTLPTLREHLRMAQDAGKAVGLTGSLITSKEEEESVGGTSSSATGRGTRSSDTQRPSDAQRK